MKIALLLGLCGLYGCLQLDKQMPVILAESVKLGLGLRDSQLGALNGGSFGIVYALLGVYFGRRADIENRLLLACVGTSICAISCIAAAFATGYGLLVACRGGVALGEAIAVAAAVSLLGELAGYRYRARIASLFFGFAVIGGGLAALLGGWILGSGVSSNTHDRWRIAMAAAGIPGIVSVIFVICLPWRDSRQQRRKRYETDRWTVAILFAASLAAVLLQMRWASIWNVPVSVSIALGVAAFWVARLRATSKADYEATLAQPSFRWWLGSFCLVLFLDYAASFWLIPYYFRAYAGANPSRTGTELGGLMIGGGLAGLLIGGWAADRWQQSRPAGRVWAACLAVLCEGAAISISANAPNPQTFLCAFAAFSIASGAWVGMAAAIGLDIVPAAHRGTGTSIYFLFTTLLGGSLGPFIVGLWAESIGLKQALTAAALLSVVAAVVLAYLAKVVSLRHTPAHAKVGRESH